jgi:predicted XRE-type DNA-binding protein
MQTLNEVLKSLGIKQCDYAEAIGQTNQAVNRRAKEEISKLDIHAIVGYCFCHRLNISVENYLAMFNK